MFEAYAARTLIKFRHLRQKISRKGRCIRDSESTYIVYQNFGFRKRSNFLPQKKKRHFTVPSFYDNLPKSLMCSRNLFVLDFTRRFFVRCVQIFEAYAVRTLIKFRHLRREISRKARYIKNSESTFICTLR